MRNKSALIYRLFGALVLAGLAACSGNQASLRPQDGYAQAVTAPPGSLLYYEQLAETQSENPDVHFDLAIRYAQAGRLEKAEASYKQALIIKPTHVPAAVNLSDLYRGRGNYQGAIQVLELLFSTGVDDPRARTNLAALYRMTDRLDESLKQSIQITKKYGVLYGAKLNIGLIYYDRGRYEMALTVLNELLRDNPNDAILRSSVGQVYLRQDRILQAEEQFQKAVTLDTRSFSAWNGLGLVSLRKDENDQALNFFDKALEANVNYSQAYVNRGIALRKLGRYTEAAESYEKAVEINPTLVDADYNRGVLYDDYARNFTEAIVFWKQFRDKPSFPNNLTAEVDGRIDRLGKWLTKQEEERKRRTEKESAMAEKQKIEAAKKAEADRLKAEERKKAEEQNRLEAARLAAAAAAAAAATGTTQPPAAAMVSEPVLAATPAPAPLAASGAVEKKIVPELKKPIPTKAAAPVTEPSPKAVPVAEVPAPAPAPAPVTEPTPEAVPIAAVPAPAPVSDSTQKTPADLAPAAVLPQPVAAPAPVKPPPEPESPQTPPAKTAPGSPDSVTQAVEKGFETVPAATALPDASGSEKPALAEGTAPLPVTSPSP